MLPLLPAVRGLAIRHLAPPRLPGAERLASDIKAAAFLEAAVLVLVIPAAVVLFGNILPRWLASRTSGFPLLSEVPGAAFGVSLLLWRLGAAPAASLLSGALASGLLAAVFFFRGGSPKLFRLFEAANREALARIFAAAAVWGLAWRSARFDGYGHLLTGLPLVAAALFLLLAVGLSLLPLRLPGNA